MQFECGHCATMNDNWTRWPFCSVLCEATNETIARLGCEEAKYLYRQARNKNGPRFQPVPREYV